MSVGRVEHFGDGGYEAQRAHEGWLLFSEIGEIKVEQSMLVGEAGSAVAESFNGVEFDRISWVGHVFEEP